MIARLIAASARNLILVLIGTVFAVAAGVYALLHLPLDAIPDLSDTQVIVYTEYPGQAPQVVEDQVTYPLTTALLAVPHAQASCAASRILGCRLSMSMFDDGTDHLLGAVACFRIPQLRHAKRLPAGITPDSGA